MSGRRKRDDSAPGYDSFLDIVANLVGILVILIMVIGVRAKDAWTQSTESLDVEEVAEVVEELPDVDASRAELATLTDQLDATHLSMVAVEKELGSQRDLQESLHDESVRLQRKAISEQQKLKALEVESGELMESIRDAAEQLGKFQDEREQIERDRNAPAVIQHFPTPLAAAVFGREEHFRLLNGRLAHVPLNELTAQLRSEASRKVWKLEDSPTITETIGPLEQFSLRYTLLKREERIQTPSGVVRRQAVELDRFILIPASQEIGVPLHEALRSGGDFDRRLRDLVPSETTITVWTYPDSFGEFRELREYLRKRGYLTAARPLPSGHPIGGSPRGTRSAAQ